jgi:hypothetical protein
MVVMSAGLLHRHLFTVASASGQLRAAWRLAAEAAPHFEPIAFHSQDVHLAHFSIVGPLVLHFISTKEEGLPFCEHVLDVESHAHCEPEAVHAELVVSLLQQRSYEKYKPFTPAHISVSMASVSVQSHART